MNFSSPVVNFEEKRNLTRDEWVPLALLFVAYVYSQYAMNNAVKKCVASGGVSSVESYVLGAIWKVRCFK